MPGLYRKLIVWQKSMLLVEEVYRLTGQFPVREANGITSQMRRAAVSIPSNIAEGQYRFALTQNKQYLRVAYGSSAELDTQILIAQKLGYFGTLDTQICEALLDEVMRMLNVLLQRKVNLN